jgi:hypothetical protein
MLTYLEIKITQIYQQYKRNVSTESIVNAFKFIRQTDI